MKTYFVASGFVAKYPEGGGNFSVVLQYLLGLKRMGLRAIWLEVMPAMADPSEEARLAATFHRRLKAFGLEKDYCLLVTPSEGEMQADKARNFGLRWKQIRSCLKGENVLLNLSGSLTAPFVLEFERRILCSLDPTEICFWMNRMEMGQSSHQEFATIGLNAMAPDSKVPRTKVTWKTFFPLVDCTRFEIEARPKVDRFTTIGQWYWDGCVEFDGEWRDFSKKAAFAKFMNLPALVPEARFDLAMNLNADDPEIARLAAYGWNHRVPHQVARTPAAYYEFIRQSSAEFSAVKLESHMRSGWLSDRSAVYLAMGRPVVTESTGAERVLPNQSGFFFVNNLEEAVDASKEVIGNWDRHSRDARMCAEECFDAPRNLERILA